MRVVYHIASGRFGLTVVAFLKKLKLYKSRNLSLTPTASPTSRPLRQPCYSPDEFHRGIQAMQSWFRNLDDSQRTLALQSITVRTTFLTARFILLIRRDFLKTTKLLQCSKPKLRNSTCKSSSGIKSKL